MNHNFDYSAVATQKKNSCVQPDFFLKKSGVFFTKKLFLLKIYSLSSRQMVERIAVTTEYGSQLAAGRRSSK